jgi:predicted enzyme related to lactoylglutathione lyase
MTHPSLFIFYVENPVASAAFYAGLLGREPLETSETFALFRLESGASLGLWSRHTVEPKPGAGPGASEMAFHVKDVDTVYRDWSARGLTILQEPADMDFGRSFMARDPDGHRLRVYKMVDG